MPILTAGRLSPRTCTKEKMRTKKEKKRKEKK